MVRAAARQLGPRLGEALAIAPSRTDDDAFDVLEAGHPLPTPASVTAGRRALAMAAARRPGDRLLVLLSGGASALMAVPADGLTLDDKAAVTRILLQAGAGIHQLNAVRKHLSAIKGGQLASAGRGRVLTLAISDVIGDDLSVIGSGPTVPDASSFADALEVVRELDRHEPCPAAAMDRLRRGAAGGIPETPKRGDPRLEGHEAHVIGGRRDAMAGAARAAEARGYTTVVLEEPVQGEARNAGPRLLERALAVSREAADASAICVIASGETTVRVVGGGLGGRNQELVLACVEPLARLDRELVLASVGTDGVDGPTRAAGALADSTSAARAAAFGVPSPQEFLRRNDAFRFFEGTGDLIVTGPTGTNVGDLQVILVAPRRSGTVGAASV